MQQILLSSQNILPNQATAQSTSTSTSPATQASHSAQVPLKQQGGVIGALLSGNEKTPLNQELESSFLSVLNSIELPQGKESMKEASLAGWKNLLNENPELFDQLEQNPEAIDQLQAFIEGQALSSGGEPLPPLTKGEVLSGVDSNLINQPLVTSAKSQEAVQSEVSNFLSDYDPVQVVDRSPLGLDVAKNTATKTNINPADVSVPYMLTGQGDSNAKTWGRFASVNQATASSVGGENSTVNPNLSLNITNTGGVVPQIAADSGLGLMQNGAGITNLQSESDVQFKSSFDSFSLLDAEAGDVVETVRGAERSEATKTQFADIQSKLQGTGLKQYSMSLETNVQDPEWGDAMGQKIVWLAGRAIQSAEIHLNPADLGPIDVKINVQNEQAVVTFHAQNSTVRDMLESNVQRLRDMMESNGVDLSEVSVGSEDSGGKYAAQDGDGSEGRGSGEPNSEGQNELAGGALEESSVTMGVSNRIVDFYA